VQLTIIFMMAADPGFSDQVCCGQKIFPAYLLKNLQKRESLARDMPGNAGPPVAIKCSCGIVLSVQKGLGDRCEVFLKQLPLRERVHVRKRGGLCLRVLPGYFVSKLDLNFLIHRIHFLFVSYG
jgi:hypothetical protein